MDANEYPTHRGHGQSSPVTDTYLSLTHPYNPTIQPEAQTHEVPLRDVCGDVEKSDATDAIGVPVAYPTVHGRAHRARYRSDSSDGHDPPSTRTPSSSTRASISAGSA